MWGISLPNLQMMLADSVASLIHTDENNTGEQGVGLQATKTPGTHTTPPMNFGDFLKTMHKIQDSRQQ